MQAETPQPIDPNAGLTNEQQLDELMDRDALSLTEDDHKKVLKILRLQRQAFLVTEQLPKAKDKIALPKNTSLADLGL